jgi:WD40 repeat protein
MIKQSKYGIAILLLDGRMCSVSDDGSVKIWDIETGVCDLTVQVCNSLLYRVIQLQDGRLVVSEVNDEVYIIR